MKSSDHHENITQFNDEMVTLLNLEQIQIRELFVLIVC